MPKPDKRDFEERYSACFVDFGLKMAAGILIGSMMGSFFFRGFRRWPIFVGGGLGFGMAYTNCENSLNAYLLSMDPKLCKINLFEIGPTANNFDSDKGRGTNYDNKVLKGKIS